MHAPKWTLRYVLLVTAFALCLPYPAPVVSAQDEGPTSEAAAESAGTVKFSLQPADNPAAGFIDDLSVEPGASTTVEVTVLNTGDVPVTLRLYITNAWNGTNGGFSAGTFEEEAVGSALWIDFPTQEIALEVGQQQNVSLTVKVPADAIPGQYISALVAETADTMPIPGATVLDHRIRYAMSVGILVPGEMTPAFEVGEPTVAEGALRIPLSNTGNYLVRPAGEIRLINSDGNEVINTPIELGSVYAGNSSSVAIALPEQLASGDYLVDLSLTDPESGASAQIESAQVFVPEPADPQGLSLTAYEHSPNADPIVFLDVSATITNGGEQIPAANVVLEVSRDGEVVEEFAVATNQVLVTGENDFSSRYIPSDGSWEPGTYTIAVSVSAVNIQSDQEIELLNTPVEGEINVP